MVLFFAEPITDKVRFDMLVNLITGLLGGIVGAVIGAYWSDYFQRKGEDRRKKEVAKALAFELLSIRDLVPQKKDLITKLGNTFKLDRYPNITPIPFPKAIYSQFLPTLYTELSIEQVGTLYLIYTYLGIVDDTLNNLDAIVAESKQRYTFHNQGHMGAAMKMGELEQILDRALDLLNYNIDGKTKQYQYNEVYFGAL